MLFGLIWIETRLDLPVKEDDSHTQIRQKLKRIDFGGALFMTLTILSSLIVVDLGGQKLKWSHPVIVAAGATAAFCSLGFVVF